MERRSFIKQTTLVSASFFIAKDMLAKDDGPIYGHGNMRYRMDTKWSKADPNINPVNDCHEFVQDKKGRIMLLTNETKNNVLIFDKSGKLLDTWGHDFPGAHGFSRFDENGTEVLFITDTVKHQVYKTTIDGKILMTIDVPLETGVYKDTNGDFYIADGYGAQYITHYDKTGKLLNFFGGKGEGDEHLDNAHGITIDRRQAKPTLIITDRTRNCFKRFSMDGKLIEVIKLPGACVCRPVIKGDHLYAAVLRSPDLGKENSGFTTILDKNNKVVSNLGGSEPVYKDGVLQPMSQAEKIFLNPHDVCVDNDENLYVAQWASGKVYPYKFTRV
jgi:peptidylamidoglycolate lyase